MTQTVTVKATRIEGGYLITVGDQSEPMIAEPNKDGYLTEGTRVAQALSVPWPKIHAAIARCTDETISEILASPRPLDLIGGILDDAIAGEDDNKRLLFVLLLSGLTMDPGYSEMILFKSSSGGGKSHLASFLTLAYKTKKVGRLSRTALDYSDLADHQILYLQELGQIDSEEHGVSTVKFLSSEDEGYTIEITVRDPDTGAMTTMQKKIPPLTVISSTTRVNVDGQYERRNWIMSVDETPEQTERIRQLNARHEIEKLEMSLGLRAETNKDRADRLMKALVETVKPVKVGILFPDTLMGILKSEKLRIRGDFKKIIRLLNYYSWLRQRTLPSIETNGERIIFPTPQAAIEILEAAVKPLTFMTQDLEGRDLKLLSGFKDLAIKRKGDVINPDLRDELRLKLGYSKDTIKKYLNNLVDRGFLTDDDKKPKTYYLVNSLDHIEREISSVSEAMANPETLILDMTQEATRNLERLATKMPQIQQLAQDFTYRPECHTKGPYPDSQQSPDNQENPKIPPNQPDSGFIPIIPAQNAIGITAPTVTPGPIGNPVDPPLSHPVVGETETPEPQEEPRPPPEAPEPPPDPKPQEDQEPWTPPEQGQAALKPKDKRQGAVAKWPKGGPLSEDIERFLTALWNHQETQGHGPIRDEALMKRLAWEPERFNKIRDVCLRDGTLFRPGPGRLAMTW